MVHFFVLPVSCGKTQWLGNDLITCAGLTRICHHSWVRSLQRTPPVLVTNSNTRVSLSKIQYLSIPISNVAAVLTIILPLLTGAGIRGAQSALIRSDDSASKRRRMPSWVVPAGFVFLVIYETAIATMSLGYMVPAEDLTCRLQQRWHYLFDRVHDVGAITRIQDAHQCCGLHTIRDRGWPSRGSGDLTCSTTFNRNRSCLNSWRQDEQIYAGLLLLVAVGSFLVKVSHKPYVTVSILLAAPFDVGTFADLDSFDATAPGLIHVPRSGPIAAPGAPIHRINHERRGC